MKLSEILKLTAQYAQQIVLLRIVEEVVDFLEHDQYRFADLLNALSEYTARASTIDKENPNWSLVSEIIKTAARKIEPTNEKNKSLKKSLSEYYRQAMVLQMVTVWLDELQNVKCRISYFLAALGNYAEGEARNQPDKDFWSVIASQLKAGSEIAEQEGNELP